MSALANRSVANLTAFDPFAMLASACGRLSQQIAAINRRVIDFAASDRAATVPWSARTIVQAKCGFWC